MEPPRVVIRPDHGLGFRCVSTGLPGHHAIAHPGCAKGAVKAASRASRGRSAATRLDGPEGSPTIDCVMDRAEHNA